MEDPIDGLTVELMAKLGVGESIGRLGLRMRRRRRRRPITLLWQSLVEICFGGGFLFLGERSVIWCDEYTLDLVTPIDLRVDKICVRYNTHRVCVY